MADTPLPTPSSSSGPPAAEARGSTLAEGVQAQINGVPATHVTTRPAGGKPTGPTFHDLLLYRLKQLGALVALWAILFVFLWKVLPEPYAFPEPINALGFSIILAVIASFFLHSLLPFQPPAEPHAPAEPHPPAAQETAAPGFLGEVRQVFGWWVGLVLVLVCGWGGIIVAGWATGSWLVAAVASIVSLGIFLLLEGNVGLSRLMDLRGISGLPWWGSAVIFWLPGGVLLRSTAAKTRPVPDVRGKALTLPAESPQVGDSVREIIETVVFVVVLVLMLKSFVAEAFVIPTGSMAETLYGYQKMVTCPECGIRFPVNCSAEVDPSDDRLDYVHGGTCPNCRLHIRFVPRRRPDGTIVTEKDQPEWDRNERLILDPGWRSGDRVLVSKFVYDLPGKMPNRLDVVVFKFPGNSGNSGEPFPARSGPVKKHSPMNYIKRLIGKPGETIAIFRGKIYVLPPDSGMPFDDFENAQGDPSKLARLWQESFMHTESMTQAGWKANGTGDNPRPTPALDLFFKGKFQIVRKPPEVLLAMRRLVYDNDHPARDLGPEYERWRWRDGDDSAWASDGKRGFVHNGTGTGLAWLDYRNLICQSRDRERELKQKQEELDSRKQAGDDVADLRRQIDELTREKQKALENWPLITDFMGYNSWEASGHQGGLGVNWVSDLLVECAVQVKSAQGVFALELAKGPDRFQARFDLKDGTCKLLRVSGKQEVELKSAMTTMNHAGNFKVRFANVDDRLTVWVDGRLPFGDGVEYEPTDRFNLVPVRDNDLKRPVSVGAWAQGLTVSGLKVYRDTYYTTARNRPSDPDVTDFVPTDPDTWTKMEAPAATFYVQPDHFLCMGDNSPESSDGRSWGLVPRRLMLGRALLVYYPFARGGRIR
jgi:signal peptidase I